MIVPMYPENGDFRNNAGKITSMSILKSISPLWLRSGGRLIAAIPPAGTGKLTKCGGSPMFDALPCNLQCALLLREENAHHYSGETPPGSEIRLKRKLFQ